MQNTKIRHAISYAQNEILKLSLFLALLYGFVFGILRQPSTSINPTPTSVHPEKTISVAVSPVSERHSVEIPRINISAPLLIVASKNAQDFVEPLQQGVTLFPSSTPGKPGTAVILGHSAPLGWPKIRYDWVFSDINKLQQGDEIRITFDTIKYTYRVKETILLQRGQEIPASYLEEKNSHILLISCWPPGIDNKRIGVYAEIDKM